MTTAKKTRPISPDLLGAELAIKRAAQRAREIAIQTNTPCIVRQDGKLVDITKRSAPGAN
ncbi:hypothetical protein SKTS_09150 [Sulfurimicrobium lacus]|uniref:Uncharacterized protein n=1 Tax=Sulfurimicrobium lacus TaxID=2715678 RepID=A0A6F8VBA1_9PROT|nr:hypothetical protein [Sulfurimicrobium lacus]BCB26029.1 hypothetical protein SKTS_09150 [Sulfurimicrobium lacus]